MNDLKGAIRGAADRHRPPGDWLDRIHERVRTKRRNRRVLAGVVGIGVPLALTVVLVAEFALPDRTTPGADRSTAPTMCGTGFEVEPTGWWQGNGSVADAVSGRNAVLHGDAAFGPGIVGDAFVLDGEGDFVDVPDHPTLNVGSEDFTVSLWVRFASTQGEQVLVEDWIQTYDRRTMEGWTLTKLKSNVIGFGAATAGGVDTEPLDLPIDTWIHVAARRRAGSMSVFIDGELVANRRMTNPGQSADSDASLKFGHRGSRDDTPGSLDRRGFFLNGDLDEATIFVGHGLSDEAIRNIFESQSSCVV